MCSSAVSHNNYIFMEFVVDFDASVSRGFKLNWVRDQEMWPSYTNMPLNLDRLNAGTNETEWSLFIA